MDTVPDTGLEDRSKAQIDKYHVLDRWGKTYDANCCDCNNNQ